MGGFLKGNKLPLGDGVDQNDKAFRTSFPYVASPFGGLRLAAQADRAGARAGPGRPHRVPLGGAQRAGGASLPRPLRALPPASTTPPEATHPCAASSSASSRPSPSRSPSSSSPRAAARRPPPPRPRPRCRPRRRPTRPPTSASACLQATVRAAPKRADGWTLLAGAYLQKVRETGDAGFYTRAQGAVDRALSLRPADPGALTAAQRARALAPRLQGRPARRAARPRAGARP